MSVKRSNGSEWTDLTVRRRFVSGEWVSMEAGKRYGGGVWHWLWSRDHQYVKEYPLTSKEVYKDGEKYTMSLSSYVAEGSVDGNTFSNNMTLMGFNFSDIVGDTAGAVINSMELYLQRETSSQSMQESVTAHVGYLSNGTSSFPNTYRGAGLRMAVSTYPTFGRTEGKWVTLLDAVAAGIQNGSVKMLALGRYDVADNFCIFPMDQVKLRVTYTVTDG